MDDASYLFASHARVDADKVLAFVEGLRSCGVNIWIDIDGLRPGEQWMSALEKALLSARGLLIFVSNRSMQSKFVRSELAAFARDETRLIIPVIIERMEVIPPQLGGRQYIDISGISDLEQVTATAKTHAKAIASSLTAAAASHATPLHSAAALGAAEILTELQARPKVTAEPPRSVFLIHGHEEIFLNEIESFLRDLNIDPVVLKRIGGPDQSLWQKFKKWSKDTRYAIALLTPDDLGAAKREYESDYEGRKVGSSALQYRARQNVILELGYFYGYLDWDRVFVLFKPAANPYPRFEMPSDLAGIVYDTVDASGHWKITLRRHLEQAGFVISPQ